MVQIKYDLVLLLVRYVYLNVNLMLVGKISVFQII